MISFEEALKTVLSSAKQKGTSKKKFTKTLHRVLREDVFSDMDMPPWDKAAVDGYACRRIDLAKELEVIETVPAGKMPRQKVGAGQCIKIMTGAPVPQGADTVIMVEDTQETSDGKIRFLKEKTKSNIAYHAEDIQKGDLLIPRNTLLKPKHIAILATAGCVRPQVSKKVKVAVISTGDELVEPHQVASGSKIRNSNAYQLMAQIQEMGAKADYTGIAKDTEESTRKLLKKAFHKNDVILLTGGVSMGDFDYVPQILKEMGVEIIFKSIAVQPGRPTVFGIRKRQYIFGLPGNPVSSFVQFEMLVKPLIYKIMGFDYTPLTQHLPAGARLFRKNTKRMSWKPVKIISGKIFPLEYHGSAHINSLIDADALVAIPRGKEAIEEGEVVAAHIIR